MPSPRTWAGYLVFLRFFHRAAAAFLARAMRAVLDIRDAAFLPPSRPVCLKNSISSMRLQNVFLSIHPAA